MKWKTVASHYILNSQYIKVKSDRVITHLQEEITYSYVEHPGCVIIIALTDSDEVVLIRQYRYPVDDWCLELPAGRIENADPLASAVRELQEEIGCLAGSLEIVGDFYNSNGSSNEKSIVIVARDLSFGESAPEKTELIEQLKVKRNLAVKWAKTGKIKDGASALSLIMADDYLKLNQKAGKI